MISLTCGIYKTKQNKTKRIDTENRLMVARWGGVGWAKWVKWAERYQLPDI